MPTNDLWHQQVTASIGGAENYGKGIFPNPYHLAVEEYRRRDHVALFREQLTRKIHMLTEPRFITGTETSELMEALVTMIDARNILELGMHTGRTTLHLLRAIIGKTSGNGVANVTSIDARPAHDREFFEAPALSGYFTFIHGWTPQCLDQLAGRVFDFVFVDSDHSVEHTQKELEALMKITRSGSMLAFHDVPRWQTPANRAAPPVRDYLESLIGLGNFTGMLLPSPRQLDAVEEWGSDYPIECSPGLAVLIRK